MKVKLCLLKSILLLCGTIFFQSANAQFFHNAEDPSSLKWKQIETKYHRVVFDEEFEPQAQKVAAYLDYSSKLVGDTLLMRKRKLPILIHNHSVTSNGMVAWYPSQMELYTVPPQDIYAQGWYEQLAIHEGRHVAQLYRIFNYTPNILYLALGEQGILPGIGQAHPWFLEGDAVVTETALTNSGRGRLPSFQMGYRSILLEKDYYSFRKAVFGSFRDYVPNHYELGYMMVAYNRAKYSPKLWEYTLNRIGNKIIFTPFLGAVKEATGMNRTKLYKQTFDYYKDFWKKQTDSLSYTDIQILNKTKNGKYLTYFSPVFYQGKIYAIKKSLDEIASIVEIDPKSGNERKIILPGYIPSDRIQIQNGVIYWEEETYDVRWAYRTYNEIRTYDLKTGKSKYLTHHSRYLSPAPSPDGLKIAAVETDVYGNNYLVVLSASNGYEIAKYAASENAALQLPSWNETSDRIVMTRVNNDGKNIVEFNISTHSWRNITEPSAINISTPVYKDNKAYFNASYSGIDNVYNIDTARNQIFQVTSVKNGAFSPFFGANSDNIYFSNYTSDGFDIVSQLNDSNNWVPLNKIKKLYDPVTAKIASQEPRKFDYKEIDFKKYPVKPYNKFTHLVNLHSWLPYYIYTNPDGPTEILPMYGLTVWSQNLHKTLTFSGGSGIAYGRSYSNLGFTYSGFFPVITGNIFYGDSINYVDNSKTVSDGRLLQFDGSISLPLNFSKGSNIIGFTPAFLYRYENRYYIDTIGRSLQGVRKYGYAAEFYAYQKYTFKQIAPRLGIVAYFGHKEPIDNPHFAISNVFTSNLFLPGLSKLHSLRLKYKMESHTYQENQLVYPSYSMLGAVRGFMTRKNPELDFLKQMQVFSADYLLPLAYPDITILKVIYLKRLRSSLFYDHALAKYYNNGLKSKNFNAAGIEILADFNLFFIPAGLSLGTRVSYINPGKEIIPEIVIGTDIFGSFNKH